ncbi:uncharacterized protein [Elaeis guineensis]|uniref:Post-GPI attachment to proteins factor 3 n=1 Tax=Elaeis guineensis var. tenera TaxID=51953 RepID=A0A6I9R266_ELAGV|nr:post-GPI attachment to proteins factor 3 isoform X2 [Elaeis guineensis]
MSGRWVLLVVLFGCILGATDASEGDADPLYRDCTEQCQNTGSFGNNSIQHCQFSSGDVPGENTFMKTQLYSLHLKWKQWKCRSFCQYLCMKQREMERGALGLKAVKYHGKWPSKHVSVFQVPVSAALSALTLVVQFYGWLSFFRLVYYKLERRPQSRRPYYEFTGLWHIYGLLSMNAWFWNAIFHIWNSDVTEKLNQSSAVALLGYSLILAILRTFNVKGEAQRVTAAAPLLAFVTTHILYLNFYKFDHGLNMKVCIIMDIAQAILWVVWAAVTRPPSWFKLWTVMLGGILVMLLEEFPSSKGYVDLRHAAAIPLAYLWWNFVKKDAETRTSAITKKRR